MGVCLPEDIFFYQTKKVFRNMDKNKHSFAVEVERSDFYGFLELVQGKISRVFQTLQVTCAKWSSWH